MPAGIVDKAMNQVRKRFKCTEPVRLASASSKEPLVFLAHEMWMTDQHLVISQASYVSSLLEKFDVGSPLKTIRPEEFKGLSEDSTAKLGEKEHTLLDPNLAG